MQYLTKTTCSSVEKRVCASDLIVTYSFKIFHLICSKKMNSQCKCDVAVTTIRPWTVLMRTLSLKPNAYLQSIHSVMQEKLGGIKNMLPLSEVNTATKSLKRALDSSGLQILGRWTTILKCPLEMHKLL